MSQCLPDRHMLDMRLGASLFSEARRQPIAFIRSKPSHFVRAIGQNEQGCDSEYKSGDAFEQKEPSPSGKSEPMNAQDLSGDGTAEDKSDRNSGHKSRGRFGPVLINEPV